VEADLQRRLNLPDDQEKFVKPFSKRNFTVNNPEASTWDQAVKGTDQAENADGPKNAYAKGCVFTVVYAATCLETTPVPGEHVPAMIHTSILMRCDSPLR
jgi:hypothetical protein